MDYETGLKAVEELRALVPAGWSMPQFALRWILMYEAVTCTIPGAKNPAQAEDNAAAADLPELNAVTMEKIRAIYDARIRGSGPSLLVIVHAGFNMSRRTLKNDFLELEYLTGPLRISGLVPFGKPNMLVDLGDLAPIPTPYGDFHFLGGHRLWHAPEAMPRTYELEAGELAITDLPEWRDAGNPDRAGHRDPQAHRDSSRPRTSPP